MIQPDSLVASSMTTILPETPINVDNSVDEITPLTITGAVANHHLSTESLSQNTRQKRERYEGCSTRQLAQ